MNKRTYQTVKALGFCVRYGCFTTPEPGRTMCAVHAEEHRQRNRKWRANLKKKRESEEWRRVWRRVA